SRRGRFLWHSHFGPRSRLLLAIENRECTLQARQLRLSRGELGVRLFERLLHGDVVLRGLLSRLTRSCNLLLETEISHGSSRAAPRVRRGRSGCPPSSDWRRPSAPATQHCAPRPWP